MLNWLYRHSVQIASIVVAIAALSLAVYEGRQGRYHDRLMVRPYLDIKFNAELGAGGWVLENNGLGPAIPKYFDVRVVDGEPIENFGQFKKALGNDKRS